MSIKLFEVPAKTEQGKTAESAMRLLTAIA